MLGRTVEIRKSWIAYLVGFIAQTALYVGGVFLLAVLSPNTLITGEGVRFVFVGGIGMGYTVLIALIGIPAFLAMVIGRFQRIAAIYVMILGFVLVGLLVTESLMFALFPIGLFVSAYYAWTEASR